MDDSESSKWKPIQGTLFVFLVMGVLGLTFFFTKYDDVFPAASLDLKVTQKEIVAKARKICADLGYSTQNCIDSTTFGDRNEVTTFLEREYSMREANELMHSKINAFYWYTRFCRPSEEEEFQVCQDPEGKLVALNHDIEKEAKLPTLSQEEAQVLALRFVEEKAGKKLYKKLPNQVSSSQEKPPAISSKAPEDKEQATASSNSPQEKAPATKTPEVNTLKAPEDKERATASSNSPQEKAPAEKTPEVNTLKAPEDKERATALSNSPQEKAQAEKTPVANPPGAAEGKNQATASSRSSQEKALAANSPPANAHSDRDAHSKLPESHPNLPETHKFDSPGAEAATSPVLSASQNSSPQNGESTARKSGNGQDSVPKIELADGIKLIKQGSVKQQNRVDHSFTWEDENQDFKGGKLRTTVTVSGNMITSYDCSLHVPEDFEHKFANMRSYNDLLKQISSVLFAIVGAAMFFSFVWALSTKRVRWRLVAIAAAVSFSIEILDYWNNWPSIIQSYSTTESLHSYLLSKLVSSLLAAALAAFSSVALVGGIEAVYRNHFPKAVAGEHFLKFKFASNRSILETVIAGICVFGVHIGYVAAFYLLGSKMGMWSPLEVRDVATMSSFSPAFSSFVVGVNASVSEELLYRVLCFCLAQRVFKNFWIANFVQAAGWAFMHSDYPQEPPYARGVELTIVGLFYGYMMKRYGVMAGIIAHFIYDAFLGITPMLFSTNLWLAFSGLLACTPPFALLAVGLAKRSKKGEDQPTEPLLNENLKNPHQDEPGEPIPERHLSYSSLGKQLKVGLLMLCVLSSMVLFFVHPRKIGTWARMTVSKAKVEEVARNFMRDRGVAEGDWTVSAVLNVNFDDDEVQYGFEKEGFKKTEAIMKAARIPLLWWVRFFKPHQHREYDVAVTSEGRPVSMQVVEDEDAPGKRITSDEAKKLTEDFLKRYRPEFQPLQFESVVEQNREKRNDNTVSYVVPAFKMGDARLKISVDTVGDMVSFPHVTWDIPDKWRFEREKKTTKDVVVSIVAQLILGLFGIAAIIWAYGVVKSTSIHWRASIIVGSFVAMLTLISQANELQYNLIGYDTDVPFSSFLLKLGIKALVAAISYGAIYSVIFAVSHCAFRILCPGVTLASIWHSCVQPTADRLKEARQFWVDGVYSAYAWILGLVSISTISGYLQGMLSPSVVLQQLDSLVDSTHYLSPSLAELISAITLGIASLCLAPAAIGFFLKYFRNFRNYFIVSAICTIAFSSSAKHWQDFAIEACVGILEAVLVYFWIKKCARNNPVAYFLVGALNSMGLALLPLYKFTRNVFGTDMFIMLSLFLLPLVIAGYLSRSKSVAQSVEAAG